MKIPNRYGVYTPDLKETVAHHGRAAASVNLCHCDDGRYRYGLFLSYSQGGILTPIASGNPGHATLREAMDAGKAALLARLPAPRPGDPRSMRKELNALRSQLEAQLLQPGLL